MSSPSTQTASSAAATTGKKHFYMDPALVRARVGLGVKPTNPLIQFIPQCKNIDEFNAFTKTELYHKLMDYRNPLHEVKMDPSYRKYYDRVQKKRAQFLEHNDYPIYEKLPSYRLWYRATWASVILLSAFSLKQLYIVISEH